ncbi:MAG: c-type cytochrome [Acidobacteriaceae bacterium]
MWVKLFCEEERMLCWCRSVVVLLAASGLVFATQLGAQKIPGGGPSPTTHGSALFESNCAACHGSDGRGGEQAPDIATNAGIQELSTGDLAGIIGNGVAGAGMPAFHPLGLQKIQEIVAYLRVLQGGGGVSTLPGDPHAGEVLFFGKARCASCHMVKGEGGFIADDLTHYGVDKTVSEIRNTIADPDKYLPSSKLVTVVTRSGQKITGMVRSNDHFTISIQTMDGAPHFFQKSYIKQIDLSSHSLMPGDYSSTLNNKQLDDLVSYLMKAGRENSTPSPMRQPRGDDEDDNFN